MNGSERYLTTYSEHDSGKYYPLTVHQPLVPPYPQIPLCLSPLPCTPESSGDNQTDSASLGAPVDGQGEERLETSFTVQPDDMTGKHWYEEKIPLERAPFLEREGKAMPKRE